MDKLILTDTQSGHLGDPAADMTSFDEPMTEAQKWHLRFLSADAGEVMSENLSKAEATIMFAMLVRGTDYKKSA